jgi:hypothetical protein
MDTRCECVICCDGEHAGECKHCAGWGDRLTGSGIKTCNHCGGSGICQICHGANLPVCHCGMPMRDHNMGSSCTLAVEMI